MPAERGETVGNKPRMDGGWGGGGTGARRLRVKAAAVWTGAFKAPPLCFPLSANTENVPLPSLATAAHAEPGRRCSRASGSLESPKLPPNTPQTKMTASDAASKVIRRDFLFFSQARKERAQDFCRERADKITARL